MTNTGTAGWSMSADEILLFDYAAIANKQKKSSPEALLSAKLIKNTLLRSITDAIGLVFEYITVKITSSLKKLIKYR